MKVAPVEVESSRTESRLREATFGGEAAARDAVTSSRLHHDEDGDTNPRVQQIKEEIFSIDIVDVAVIRVSPARRPRIHKLETISAVLKLRPAPHNHGFCREGVAAAKVGAELVVGNVSALPRGLA